MKEEFEKYVNKFDMKESSIERKYYHSFRVMDLSKLIAKYAGFSEEDTKIAEVAGLLHDYGRFPQWTEYKTFSDIISIDHADYSIEKLFCEGEITNFHSKIKDYDEIFDAIKYHNKYAIPETLSEHNILLCKVIRDADKLDILYLCGSGAIEINECDDKVSPKVQDAFNKQKLINNADKQNVNDETVAKLAFIYDLNFKYSFKHLKDYKTVDKIYEHIKNKDMFKPYFDKIKKYIDDKLEEEDLC